MAELIAPPWEPSTTLERLDIRPVDDVPGCTRSRRGCRHLCGKCPQEGRGVGAALRSWVLADDSGLAVHALGGAPGVFSARYAGEPTDDDANNQKLLRALASVPDDHRGRGVSLRPGACRSHRRDPARGRGCLPRTIDPRAPRAGGFGYDPLFLIAEYHQTFGELSPLVKHQLSHRARAFARLRHDWNV